MNNISLTIDSVKRNEGVSDDEDHRGPRITSQVLPVMAAPPSSHRLR